MMSENCQIHNCKIDFSWKAARERAQPPASGSMNASSRQSLVCSLFERLANDETGSSDVGVSDLLRT